MKTQQRRWFKRDRHFGQPLWLDPKGTESGNEAIPDLEIRRSSTRTVQDEQLMFGQNGFCDDSAYTSRPRQTEKCLDEVDTKNE